MKERMIIYAILYAIYGGVVIVPYLMAIAKYRKQLKKETRVDLRKKAEANGWNIVECEYTIEAI